MAPLFPLIFSRQPQVVSPCESGSSARLGLCRPLAEGLFELRTSLSSRREARVLFGVQAGQIRVVHAFMKKTRATTAEDMALARQRLENWA